MVPLEMLSFSLVFKKELFYTDKKIRSIPGGHLDLWITTGFLIKKYSYWRKNDYLILEIALTEKGVLMSGKIKVLALKC